MFKPLTRIMPSSSASRDKLSHAFENVSRGVGFVAIALPIGCLLAALIGLIPPDDIQNSISHFYYTPIMGDFFVGCLFFNGILLMFMFHTNGRPVTGWSRLSSTESFLMRFAGFAAIMIAVFPTQGPSDSYGDAELLRVFVAGETGTAVFEIGALGWAADFPWHYIFAILMFVILAHFTTFVFTRDHTTELDETPSAPTPNKLRRNMRYRLLGVAIIASILLIGAGKMGWFGSVEKWDAYNGTFIFEGIALLAFGFAWLIKGRLFQSLNN